MHALASHYKLKLCIQLAVGKTGRGAGDQWVKSGDWELGDHVTELFCFDSNLKWVKVHT